MYTITTVASVAAAHDFQEVVSSFSKVCYNMIKVANIKMRE